MTPEYDLIEEVVDEMAPHHKPTPHIVMIMRNIIREALMKYDKKLQEQQEKKS